MKQAIYLWQMDSYGHQPLDLEDFLFDIGELVVGYKLLNKWFEVVVSVVCILTRLKFGANTIDSTSVAWWSGVLHGSVVLLHICLCTIGTCHNWHLRILHLYTERPYRHTMRTILSYALSIIQMDKTTNDTYMFNTSTHRWSRYIFNVSTLIHVVIHAHWPCIEL